MQSRVRMQNEEPYKLHFFDTNGDIIQGQEHLHDLIKKYFKYDTMHDHTSSGTPNEDKLIKDAIEANKDRKDAIKFLLMNYVDYKKIQNFGLDGNDDITVQNVTSLGDGPEISFWDYIKNILNIEFDVDKPENHLETCDDKRKSIYEYMRFLNIFDMGSQFPDKIPSPSYIIDSASSTNRLNEVPNICNKKENGTYNISDYIMPGDDTFNDNTNKNYSLLFYGDLQIADYFYELFTLNKTENDGIIKISESIYNIYQHTDSDKKKRLIQLSVISLNIFWQFVLSYVKLYTDLDDNDDEKKKAIKNLRHWIFVEIDIKDEKTIFNGKFIKSLNDNNSIYKIARWFSQNHDNCMTMEMDDYKECNKIYELDITQRKCAQLINEIEENIATPREGNNNNSGIIYAIKQYFSDYKQHKYILYMAQILKFTGDKSHQTISELLQVVFKKRPLFEKMTYCVNTQDRPLIAGCIMDDRPFINSRGLSQILISMGINKNISELESKNQRLIVFYVPKLKMNIIDILEQLLRRVVKYTNILDKLYDEIYDSIFTNDNEGNTRVKMTKKIIQEMYIIIKYITLVYLSFFNLKLPAAPPPASPAASPAAAPAPPAAPPAAAPAPLAAPAEPASASPASAASPASPEAEPASPEAASPAPPPAASPAPPPASPEKISDILNKYSKTELNGSDITKYYKEDSEINLDGLDITIFGESSNTNIKKIKIPIYSSANKHMEKYVEIYKTIFMSLIEYDINSPDTIKDKFTKIFYLYQKIMKYSDPDYLVKFFAEPEQPDISRPFDIEKYYKKYYKPDFNYPLESEILLHSCNLILKQNDILQKEGDYIKFFKGDYDSLSNYDSLYDSIFVYTKTYQNNPPELKENEKYLFKQQPKFDDKIFFTMNLDQKITIQDDKNYYMKNFLDIKVGSGLINKIKKGCNQKALSSGKTILTSDLEMIFNNFTEYMNEIIYLIENHKVLGKKDEIIKICKHITFKAVFFICLQFFNHIIKIKHIKSIKQIFSDNETDIENYTEDCIIHVVGLFTIIYGESYAKNSTYDSYYAFYVMYGIYYIEKEHLQNSYLNLKKKLENFLELYKELEVDKEHEPEYNDIKLI
jgi:hypothetical protein